jgi:hypothetical protein
MMMAPEIWTRGAEGMKKSMTEYENRRKKKTQKSQLQILSRKKPKIS